MVQLSYTYTTTGKSIALTRQTFVGKVMSLLFNMLSRLVLTFQVPMQCCSLQHQTSHPSPVTSTTGHCFCLGSVPSFFLELFLQNLWFWWIVAQKNWCFWTVVLEKTLESPLGCKEIKPVNPKGNQSWVFIGRTDAEVEAPILWPPEMKSWPIGKDSDAGKDWGQEEKGVTKDEMVGWHHWLNGHEFKQTLRDSEG